MSLRYVGKFWTIGCSFLSNQAEIHSVGWPLPDIIGLPGGFVRFLCIFGSM